MSVPALVVRVPLEGDVEAYVDALSESEAKRLADWLEHAPPLARDVAALATQAWQRRRAA
ncbi:MAG: hypothetical protein H0V20_05795 [Actinobacteria bacterium]|nr:hypothetical protein [Actinomycetota bacterium]